MSVLAHVFEAAGIATVVLSSVREMAVKTAPPRALHCEFPLGRPLGVPGDAAFQHDVLARAFALLDATSGPVLIDHPVEIVASDVALACSLPPRFDPDVPAAVDESRGLRRAYDRTLAERGVSSVGRAIGADEVPAALDALHRIAHGTPWTESGLPGGNPVAVCHDIRTYYEEAALALTDGPPPDGRAVETWFFDATEAGSTMLAARVAMRDAGAPFPLWFYMTPGQR
ncbi:MAG: putative D-proline reductase gamma subunit [Actinomycetota bacterium]